MKRPIRIEADAAGNPISLGSCYALVDADGHRLALFDFDHDKGCLGTAQLMRRVVRLVNAETGIRNALAGLVELGTGLLNDMGGCDHPVGICQCEDQALVDQGRAVLERLEAPVWPGEQRHRDLFTDIKQVLEGFIEDLDELGTTRQLQAFGHSDMQDKVHRAKQLLAELNRGVV